MGTSKVIIGLGVYAVIGLYALAFNTADQAVLNVSQSQAYHDQARQFANAGIKFAVGDVGASLSPSYGTTNVTIGLGSVTYVTDHPAALSASQIRVTSTGSFNTYQVTYVAILQYTGVKWTVQRIYQVPDATEYNKLS